MLLATVFRSSRISIYKEDVPQLCVCVFTINHATTNLYTVDWITKRSTTHVGQKSMKLIPPWQNHCTSIIIIILRYTWCQFEDYNKLNEQKYFWNNFRCTKNLMIGIFYYDSKIILIRRNFVWNLTIVIAILYNTDFCFSYLRFLWYCQKLFVLRECLFFYQMSSAGRDSISLGHSVWDNMTKTVSYIMHIIIIILKRYSKKKKCDNERWKHTLYTNRGGGDWGRIRRSSNSIWLQQQLPNNTLITI